jgi:hypothetical protein
MNPKRKSLIELLTIDSQWFQQSKPTTEKQEKLFRDVLPVILNMPMVMCLGVVKLVNLLDPKGYARLQSYREAANK